MDVKLFWLYFCFISIVAQGQYKVLDQNPTRIRYRKLEVNERVQIIFPEHADSLAQVTANALVKHASLNTHKWPVVIQNQGLISNGFVSMFPQHATYFSTPSQDASLLGTNDWMGLLASHESRHVFQYELGRDGISNVFRHLFGSAGQAVYANLIVPNWAWEGDAVETESRVNALGRSNIPQFSMPLRAYLSAYGLPSYARVMGRSFRNYVPNHYVFGQAFVRALTDNYGLAAFPALWSASLKKPLPFAFSKQVKKLSSLSIDAFAKTVMKQSLDSLAPDSVGRGFTSYAYPTPISSTDYVSVKTGFDVVPQLVQLTNGKERFITYLGPQVDAAMLSASEKYIVWSEIRYHPRWGQKQFSRIKWVDLQSKKLTSWDLNVKANCVSISADSKYLSMLVIADDGSSSIQVFDFTSRERLALLANLPGEMQLTPRLVDGQRLVYISNINHTKSIKIWDWLHNESITKISAGSTNIAHPTVSNDTVFVNWPVRGIDQIVAIKIGTNYAQVVTNERFGAYSGTKLRDQLIFQSYHADGYRVKKQPLNVFETFNLPSEIIEQATTAPITYSSVPYSKWHIIQPFSWGPLINSSTNELILGIESRDMLNTLQMGMGLQFDPSERRWGQYAKLSYQAWFPVIDFIYENKQRFTQIPAVNPSSSARSDTWTQTDVGLGIRIPLNLTRSAYQQNFIFSSRLNLMQIQGYDLPLRYSSEAFNGQYIVAENRLSYLLALSKTPNDIQSRWGIQWQADLKSMPAKQSLQAELWSVQSTFLMPGFGRNQRSSVRLGYQQQARGNYLFASPMLFARGYTNASFDKMMIASFDYKIPINWELNVGRVYFQKRLKASIFVDIAQGERVVKSVTTKQDLQSIGLDLTSQFHLFRFSQRFEVGARCVYTVQNKQITWFPFVLDIGF